MIAKTETWIIKHKIDEDGNQFWYKNGKLHREDGPTIINPDGNQLWIQNDELHRADGPAIINADGSEAYFINGIQFDPST